MHYQYPSTLRKYLIIIAFFVISSASVIAQSYNKTSSFKSYWQANVSGGSSLFFGDIKQYTFWPVTSNENEWRFAGSLQLIKQLSPEIGIRGQAVYGNLAGTRREWNRYFESNYIEFNINATISLRNLVSKYKSNQFWDIYFLLGIGMTNYNTEVKDLVTKKVVQKVGYGNGKSFGGRTLQGIMTGGFGLDFRLSRNWNITIESANRIMNSDDLDGKTSGFIYDVYNYTSVGISYKFGSKNSSEKKKKKKSKTPHENEYSTNLVKPPTVDALIIESVPSDVTKLPSTKEKTTVKKKTVEKPTKPTKPTKPPKSTKPTKPTTVKEKTVITPKKTISKVEYRVQISARYNKVLSLQNLSNTYKIPASQIKENKHNGYYIYTVGSFATYEQAREKRNSLRGYNGISDAFIVAFKNGERLNKLPQ